MGGQGWVGIWLSLGEEEDLSQSSTLHWQLLF